MIPLTLYTDGRIMSLFTVSCARAAVMPLTLYECLSPADGKANESGLALGLERSNFTPAEVPQAVSISGYTADSLGDRGSPSDIAQD
jgi:hypothetical protein